MAEQWIDCTREVPPLYLAVILKNQSGEFEGYRTDDGYYISCDGDDMLLQDPPEQWRDVSPE